MLKQRCRSKQILGSFIQCHVYVIYSLQLGPIIKSSYKYKSLTLPNISKLTNDKQMHDQVMKVNMHVCTIVYMIIVGR